MQLAVFGGSGRTGRELLELVSTRGWSAKALVRPASVCPPRPGVEILRGSLESPADLLSTVEGADAVICVFGPRSSRSAPFRAAATARIVSTMRSAGPRRLLCQTGAMMGELPANVSPAMRAAAALYRRRFPDLAEDAWAQEREVMESGLDWTLVKPPRLTNSRSVRAIRAGPALRVGLLSKVGRRVLAAFLLDEAASGRHIRQRVYGRC